MKVLIKNRTGKDFFEYMNRCTIDIKLANDWALEEFVTIDGKPMNIDQISKLKTIPYLKLTSAVFSTDVPPALMELETGDVVWNDIEIKSKSISRDFITELQTYRNKSKNNIDVLKFCLNKFYDISNIETYSYELTAFLIGKINHFLTPVTTTENQFDIDDTWFNNPI
jgi:hypothetical protein